MRDRPPAEDLLQTARRLVLDELLGVLPAGRRYTARMIANAMGIAARELAAGEEPLRRELERLCKLLNRPLPVAQGRPALERETDALNRELARRIRAGDFDGVWRPLRDHLLETTIDKLRESNPKYLEARSL